MSQSPSRARSVTVDLPDEVFHRRSWDPQEIAEELRVLWLLEEVRSRRLGFGKAAELAGLPQARFLLLMGKHGITPFDYDEAELAEAKAPTQRHSTLEELVQGITPENRHEEIDFGPPVGREIA